MPMIDKEALIREISSLYSNGDSEHDIDFNNGISLAIHVVENATEIKPLKAKPNPWERGEEFD